MPPLLLLLGKLSAVVTYLGLFVGQRSVNVSGPNLQKWDIGCEGNRYKLKLYQINVWHKKTILRRQT